jgi:FKBP-type peptidyl-prolyl cis-trans isomerase FkpA
MFHPNNLKNSIAAFLCIAGMLLNISCKQGKETKENQTDSRQLRETLIRANIAAARAEDEQINDFIERNGWSEMQKTGSGLRYWIYYQGNGTEAKEGMVAKLDYTLRLLSGDIIYSSFEGGPMQFLIGKGGVESGLEEAILLLRVGDKAKIIIPSHLGFGLTGDDHKIPPKSTLVYDVELLLIIKS